MAEDEEALNFLDKLGKAAEGGLLRLLTGKVVEQALGRLISGVFSVPTAYLEHWAQRKRNDTLAEGRIAASIASKVESTVVKDKDIIQRGTERWTEKILGRQRSVEDVAVRTLDVLVSEGELPPEAAAPAEDFMRTFEDMAERATTAAVADLLARVLAGEIRKPGSVSRRTLRVVEVIDQDVAEALKETLPYMIDGGLIVPPANNDVAWRARLALLSSLSIIPDVALNYFEPDETGRKAFLMGENGIVVTAPRGAKFGVAFGGVYLTPIGQEIAALLPWTKERRVDEVALAFLEVRMVDKVEIGDTVIQSGSVRIINLRDVKQD